MADITSLSIRGIRSFGTDNEQHIAFEKPLTLILGQNGCGKTTIIECLRYSITGQMPPGSRNECFVHDTKINRSTEVMGQVKLKLINAKNKQLEITRSMRVTALPKKTRFQTLDSFLSVVDETGQVKDISSRCADLDSVLHEELGVSKAIINSVIFCHQEDSNWPLDEGKKVKERFDEIFDADKYSDCFERLRKIRKEYTVKIKLLEQDVSHWKEKKDNLDKKKLEMVNTESRLSEAELKIAELSKDLKPITEKLNAIETLQKNLVEFESKKEKLKTRLEHAKTQEKDLLKDIKNIYEGPTEELEQTISTYETTAKTKQKELDSSQRSIHTFNKDEEKTVNDMSANEVRFNKLVLLESQHQERIDKMNKLIVTTGNLADIEIAEIQSKADSEKGIETITQKIKSLRKELNELKSAGDLEEKKLQLLVDESRIALAGHKQKIKSKESEIQSVGKEIKKVEAAITDATESKTRLDIVDAKLKAADVEYENVEKELDPEQCQKEINDDEKVLEQHDHDLDQLSEKITKLQKQSAKLKEKDMIEESLKAKEKQFTLLRNKHRSALMEVLGKMPESNFAVSVNKFECDIRSEVDNMKKDLKQKQLDVTSLEAERKHTRELLKGRRAELTAAEDRLYRACGTQPYAATLARLTGAVDKLQEEQNLLQSTLCIIAKYKEQLKDNSCCPLCNRGFDAQSDVNDLISDLTTKVMNVPGKLEKVTEELQKSSAKKDELLSLKSLNEKITTLKETDIPQLEKKLTDLDTSLSQLSESVDELVMSLVEPEQKLQTIKQILGDMPLLDRYTVEIQSTTKELDVIKSQCSSLEGDMSLEEATEKQSDLRQKISTQRTRIKSLQTKLNKHTHKLQTMMQKKNKIKEELLNIQKKVQEIFTLQEKVKELESNRDKYKLELKALQDATGSLELELKEKEDLKNSSVNKNRNTVEIKRTSVQKIENSFDKVKSINKEIKQHEEKNFRADMDKIKEENKNLTEKKIKIMKDRDELTKRIESLKDELSKQVIYKRDLEDNLKLRKAQADSTTCEKAINEIQESMSGVNMDMLSEKEPLIRKQTDIFRERAQNEGMLKELKELLKQHKIDLAKPQNRDLEKKYREIFYELYVTKALDKDIKDYAISMDKCLMQFHKEKMENINLIIMELWRKIYSGGDIDYIQIKTEGGMSSDSERRKYDYRVVQIKNDVEIDMRGRCSAGQKVLACLIIRLALAETFSSRFGILALDEPTTNLDHDNVRSLCSALGDIVQERMRQKNFMFIIITHDREFIESLGDIDKVTHFYEVSRNNEAKSRIKKIRFI